MLAWWVGQPGPLPGRPLVKGIRDNPGPRPTNSWWT